MGSPSKLDRIIRRGELVEIVGVSVASIYRWTAEGDFPPPVKLGRNSVGWRESEIREWLESREPAGADDEGEA